MSSKSIATLCALFATVAAHATTSDDYAYAWPLQTDGDSAAWQVELTPEVYAAVTRADLRDIAVINAAGDAVPMAPHVIPTTNIVRENSYSLPIFSLPLSSTQAPNAGDDAIRMNIQRGPDGRLHSLDVSLVGASGPVPGGGVRMPPRDLLLDASAIHAQLSGLRVTWGNGAGNVGPQFAISTSDDLQRWQSVANAAFLHLEQDGNTLDRHEISFNDTRAIYLRMRRLDDGPDLPFLDVQVRTVLQSTTEQPARQWLPATLDGSDTHHIDSVHTSATDGSSTAAYRYHLPAPLAVEMIRIGLADDNSLARLSVISREREPYDQPSSWAQRGIKVAFHLHQGDAILDNDEFGVFPGGRTRDWRIELATPLAHAPALSVGYRPDRFVFLAQGAGPYQLVAGSARAQRGDYPLDAALAPLRAKLGSDWQPPLATLGARVILQGQQALTSPSPPTRQNDWRTWLLWVILVAAAALIGALALSLLREPKNKANNKN